MAINNMQQIQRALDEQRRLLEIANDNAMILQEDLQKATSQQSQSMSIMQQEMRSLEPALNRAKQDLESAQRTFEQAQRTFTQQQDVFKKEQDSFNGKQNEYKTKLEKITAKNENEVKTIEGLMRKKNTEISVARADRTRVEAKIRDLSKQMETEQRNVANDNRKTSTDNHAANIRNRNSRY